MCSLFKTGQSVAYCPKCDLNSRTYIIITNAVLRLTLKTADLTCDIICNINIKRMVLTLEFTKELKKLCSLVRKTVEKYNMIEDGDRIAVGVSGGKDSLTLLAVMSALKGFYPKSFEFCAIYVDTGFEEAGYCTLEESAMIREYLNELCASEGITLHIVSTHIAQIVFSEKEEKNPCSLCAKMRRGALQNTAKDLGFNKLCLGHHMDDATETFMMNLLNEGRIGAFPPVVHFDRSDITLIRPMVEVSEKDITYFINKSSLKAIKNPCPMDKTSERESTKALLKELSKEHRDIKKKILGAMERAGIDGYRP